MNRSRKFLMQPTRYNPMKHKVEGWFSCEYKFGLKCFWDGGISRGLPLGVIPWVQTPERKNDSTLSTGLWSQNLAPLPAHDGWLNQFPSIPLEGVIYQEDGYKFFGVTGSPSLDCIFQSGVVSRGSGSVKFNSERISNWSQNRIENTVAHLTGLPPDTSCELEMNFLTLNLGTWITPVHLLLHKRLPETNAKEAVKRELEKYPTGVLLRDPKSPWVPGLTDTNLLVL